MKKILVVFICLVLSGFPAFAQAPDSRPPGFETLAESLIPAVVNISAKVQIEAPAKGAPPRMPNFPPGSPFEDLFREFYDQYPNGEAPPEDEKVSSLGSGFIIDASNGYIITNNHVIKDADEVKVTLTDNTTLDAAVVGADEKVDIAVLKIKSPKALTALKWGDSDAARVGSWVLAIGNPFGLGGTVTAGIISARHRNINAGPYDEYIQTDASINRGNSGGPMFNMAGEVIGINTAIFSPSGGSVGIGFAVPSNLAKGVVEQLIRYGKTKRGWLGVKIQEVTPEIAESLKLPAAAGAMVSGLTPGGPAEKAGLKSGDVILKFDGHDIGKMSQLPRRVADAEIGKKVMLVIWRDGKEKSVVAELGELEKAEETGMITKPDGGKAEMKPKTVDVAGLGLVTLTDGLRDAYKVGKDVNGVLVATVAKNSDAAEKGLMPGDVIVEAGGVLARTPDDVIAAAKASEKAGRSALLLFIERGGDRRFVALKLKK